MGVRQNILEYLSKIEEESEILDNECNGCKYYRGLKVNCGLQCLTPC
jgi:hypothetical protein